MMRNITMGSPARNRLSSASGLHTVQIGCDPFIFIGYARMMPEEDQGVDLQVVTPQ
jgi:hypothetical protein